ncbi:MAG TPA: aldo/keto reductase [Clostridia bacterium]|nr:aldo/keto reductase [Clostridia bacterium]
MQYRQDGRSGNALSILGLGCMRLPGRRGRIDLERSEPLLMEALDSGVNYLDTAYIYTGSEAAVGQILERNHARDRAYLATKLPLMLCRAPSDFDRFLSVQLERLRTDHIDYYLMHMLTNPEQWQRLCAMGIEQWLIGKRAEGKIRQIGFSFHGRQEDFMALVDAYDWDFCQIQYNYVNTHYQAGEAGLRYAASKGLPVIVMEPLLGGRLATGLPERAEAALRRAQPDWSPAAWALRWLWNQPEVTVVLSGMSAEAQLRENVAHACASLPGELSPKALEAVVRATEAFDASNKVPCTGCGYCMPCPQHVNIPGCFAGYNAVYAHGFSKGVQQYMQSTGALSPLPANAGRCIKCRKCESHCPQNIPIAETMQTVAKRMEPFWYKAGMAVARRYAAGGGLKKK